MLQSVMSELIRAQNEMRCLRSTIKSRNNEIDTLKAQVADLQRQLANREVACKNLREVCATYQARLRATSASRSSRPTSPAA